MKYHRTGTEQKTHYSSGNVAWIKGRNLLPPILLLNICI